ncbi:MAG: radical SAM family heme chaperone HemW [Oscillospiraceae bacterium]|nr:radical SAM family heme chaperone HemW [Oscillospiraceae bacterium]
MTKPLGLYIHIPFCKAKCAYCDFYSLSHSESLMDEYCRALTAHLEEVSPRCAGMTVDTVYFGGGTPSYLGADRLCELLKTVKKRYSLSHKAEITVECNPDSATDWKALRKLRRAGFNRISLGVQSTDDTLLREIGRIHTFAQVTDAVAAARMAKIRNISLDLIYGLPGQTMEQWQDTVRTAAALEAEHLSCYGLKVEEGTPLSLRRDEIELPDDEAQAEMYLWAVDYLAAKGYGQYEISNFARRGFESRHNQKYWAMEPYAGFGPGAHSDFGDVRFAYERNLQAYIRGELTLSEREEITARERMQEYIMLSLRTAKGIDRRYFEQQYRQRFDPMETLLVQCEANGLAARTEGGWRLTPQGFLLSNAIIVSLQEAVGHAMQERLRRAQEGDFRILE